MTTTLRVGFAGTPPFAGEALAAIAEAGFDIRLVLTRPDTPQGRGLKLTPSAVGSLARERGLTVVSPASLKNERDRADVLATAIDVLVVAAYGLILPPEMLAWPRFGCINIHASLLPRWRGAAPIQRALFAGDQETGVSIMQMDTGLDTGPVITAVAVPVEPRETAGSLANKLATIGAQAIGRTLASLQRGEVIRATAQPEVGVTYAAKISRSDATIDWRDDAPLVDRQIRALNPSPGAATSLNGEHVKIWAGEPARGRFGMPGTIVGIEGAGIVVACGDGALVVRELQRAGGKRMQAAAYVAGNRVEIGAQLGNVSR